MTFRRPFVSFTKHPQYSSTGAGYPNDIALLELSSAFTLGDSIGLASLPASTNEDFTYNANCYITGWGRTSGGRLSVKIKQNLKKNKQTKQINGRLMKELILCIIVPLRVKRV